MFIQFKTLKNEKVLVPVGKILLIEEDKRGSTVVLDDGTPLLVLENIEDVAKRINYHLDSALYKCGIYDKNL